MFTFKEKRNKRKSYGFTLIEVLVAFTIAMLGMSVFYLSLSSLMANLNREEGETHLPLLSRHAYVGVYRDVNIVSRGITKEGDMECVRLAMEQDEVLRCPYLVFVREGVWVPANAYQLKIGKDWYLLPRVE